MSLSSAARSKTLEQVTTSNYIVLRELAIYIFDNKKIKSAKSPNNKENPGFLNVVTINTDTTVSAYF